MCTLSYIFNCISPITKNVGAILIQNEDLNALQITYYRYHTLSDTMSICLNGIYYTSVQNRVVYRPQSIQIQHGQ